MSVFGIFDILRGYYRVTVPGERAERIINAVYRAGIPNKGFDRLPDGTLTFRVSRKAARELRDIIDKSGVVGYHYYEGGLPFVLRRYRRRAGFFAGAALFLGIAYLSTLFIWRVEVTSDTALNKTAIERNLAAIGVKPGVFIPSCDLWQKSAEYLTVYDDCAWLSVNMSGTVAEVEVRERLSPESEVDPTPCNVVASEGGVIERFVIKSGRGYVTPGAVVRKGDLLVGGIIEDTGGEYRLTGADAEIYAEVEREVSVYVPYSHTVREYTGREKTARAFVFFGAEFRLPFGEEDPGEGWEELRDEGSPVLPDGKPLPVSLITVTWREYADRELFYTPEEALALAQSRLDRAISDRLAGARLLGVIRTVGSDENGVTASARVRCICDIAEKRAIITEDKTGE